MGWGWGGRILNFTIYWGFGEKEAIFLVLAICRYFLEVTFKTDYF